MTSLSVLITLLQYCMGHASHLLHTTTTVESTHLHNKVRVCLPDSLRYTRGIHTSHRARDMNIWVSQYHCTTLSPWSAQKSCIYVSYTIILMSFSLFPSFSTLNIQVNGTMRHKSGHHHHTVRNTFWPDTENCKTRHHFPTNPDPTGRIL